MGISSNFVGDIIGTGGGNRTYCKLIFLLSSSYNKWYVINAN
jgi:hypothetical protein